MTDERTTLVRVDHYWEAVSDSVVVTVRWPSAELRLNQGSRELSRVVMHNLAGDLM
jgi:hypothetical protein